MARYNIEIEDLDGGRVKIVATPSFEAIMKMELSGSQKMTAATGYCIALLNKAREISKSNDPRNRILIPRLRPGRMS